MSKYIDAVLPIYTILKMVWRLMTTVSSMIFIMRMSIVNARTRKEGLYIHDIDVIEMEPVLTWNCNSSKMTSWRPSAFWITTIFTSPQRDCTWVMRNFDVFVVVGLNYQLDKQSSCRWFETLLHSCEVHAISVIQLMSLHYVEWENTCTGHLFKWHMMECRQPQYAPITINSLCLTWSKVVSFFFSEFRRC